LPVQPWRPARRWSASSPARSRKAAALEAQMDTVAALLGATADQAELLRQATLDLALDPNLSVSATEAAQAIEMLAQNGLTVEQILGRCGRGDGAAG
jgi:hypothetical protein